MRLHAWWAAAALFAGCAHVATVGGLDQKVREVPGGFVSGQVVSLERSALLDNRDFVYSVGMSADGSRAAFTHLAGRTFNLGVWNLGADAKKVFDVATNVSEFDVEAVAFSPDGRFVATAGRDGAVRLYDAASGKLSAETTGEEPLVSLTFLSDGTKLVAGSARGRVTLYSASDLGWISEARVHSDEVRALEATPDGRVVTGSWDKSIAVLELTEERQSQDEVRMIIGRREQTRVVRAGLEGWVASFAFDALSPLVVVSDALARKAGIESGLLTESANIGGYQARVARHRTMQLKFLKVPDVDIAICDACLPKGTQGILGAAVLKRFDFRVEELSGELVLSPKEKPDESTLPLVPTLREVKRLRFDAFVNDLSVDREGRRLGVAFSAQKAERDREVYQREKRGEAAPFSEADAAAIVDLDSGDVVQRWSPHLGVVSTAAISPDGRTLASGGWDRKLFVLAEGEQKARTYEKFGWSVRRARFSRDGRLLGVGAWTPQNAVGSQESDPSAVIYEVGYGTAQVKALR